MDIWLFSLVFISIIIGWLLGRWKPFRRKLKTPQPEKFSESYAKGLNYLLSDESDKAIQVFTQLLEINSDTIEVHVTLGNLFRSRGEVDRAIKIHQNILARPNLSRNQRHMVVAELAADFSKAGLLDRAENLYREMIELNTDTEHAYRCLLDLYMTEKSWEEAIECASKLHENGDLEGGVILSHCYCEIAVENINKGDRRSARKNLDLALVIDVSCVRAMLMLTRIHVETSNFSESKSLLDTLVKQHPEYLDLYIEPAKDIYAKNRDSKGYLKFISQQYQRKPGTQLAVALLEYYATHGQIEKAQSLLESILRESPSFEVFEFALRFLDSKPSQILATWQQLHQYLETVKVRKIRFVCHHCGYESHSMQWNCPSCRSWSSVKPIQE
jgi:lipopolysaccharide assembly protein B